MQDIRLAQLIQRLGSLPHDGGSQPPLDIGSGQDYRFLWSCFNALQGALDILDGLLFPALPVA